VIVAFERVLVLVVVASAIAIAIAAYAYTQASLRVSGAPANPLEASLAAFEALKSSAKGYGECLADLGASKLGVEESTVTVEVGLPAETISKEWAKRSLTVEPVSSEDRGEARAWNTKSLFNWRVTGGVAYAEPIVLLNLSSFTDSQGRDWRVIDASFPELTFSLRAEDGKISFRAVRAGVEVESYSRSFDEDTQVEVYVNGELALSTIARNLIVRFNTVRVGCEAVRA